MVQERTEMKIENELRLWQLKRHQRTNAINYCLHLNQKKKLWKLLYGSTQFEHDVQPRGGIINGFDK